MTSLLRRSLAPACRERHAPSAALLLLFLLLALAGCGEGEPEREDAPAPQPASIETSLATLELRAIGERVAVEAQVLDDAGAPLPNVPLSWSSTDPSVAEPLPGGVVVARGTGEARIEIRGAGLEASLPVAVRQVADRLRMEPEQVQLRALGAQKVLRATARDANGHPIPNPSLVWLSLEPEVATVEADGTVTARGPGQTEILVSTEEGAVQARARVLVTQTPARAGVRVELPPAFVAGQPARVRVLLVDEGGQPILGAGPKVTIALGESAPGTRLEGTLAVNAVDGVALFPELRVNRAGTGFTLVAAAAGFGAGESAVFSVAEGPPARLRFLHAPKEGISEEALAPAIQVELLDAAGNRASGASGEIAVALGQNPAGATLSGTLRAPVIDGVATFADLRIDRAGAGFTLRASGDSLAEAESGPLAIRAGAPARLAFAAQPGPAVSQRPLAPAPRVEVFDRAGNLVEAAGIPVRLALAAHPSGASLSGTDEVQTQGGAAVFSSLSVARAGQGYFLIASSPGLVGATSAAFDVAAGEARALRFSAGPQSARSGESLGELRVQAVDAAGNPTQGSGAVALALHPGGELLGAEPRPFVDGVAVFPAPSVAQAGSGYRLVASAGSLTAAMSDPFDVTPGAPARLRWLRAPSATASGEPLAPAPQVEVLDAAGNRIQVGGDPIRVELIGGSGTLAGAATASPEAGVATFPGLSVDRAGSHRLLASSASLPAVESPSFAVTPGPATQLAWTVQPGSTTAGKGITLQVELRDAAGNKASAGSHPLNVSIATGPAGATLGGPTTVASQGGVASFTGLFLDKSAPAYTLVVRGAGLGELFSDPFAVAAGAPVTLRFLDEPADRRAGEPLPALRVQAVDAYGNGSAVSGVPVSIALARNPGGGALGGTRSATLSDGVARFEGLHVDRVGQGYTLAASAANYQAAESAPFAVRAGDAAAVRFLRQPADSLALAPLAPVVEVELLDAAGNRAVESSEEVRLRLVGGPSDALLSGSAQGTPVAGVVAFPGLRIDRAGSGYRLEAAANAMAPVQSQAFSVLPAAPRRLAFVTQPGDAAAGASLLPAPRVEVLDEAGNRVEAGEHAITVSLGSNPAGATLRGEKSRRSAGGVATFTGLSLDKAGGPVQLHAASLGLEGAASEVFTIHGAAPAGLIFLDEPVDVASNAELPPLRVGAVDANGNRVEATGTLTLSLGQQAPGATLSGERVVALDGGVATFTGLRIDKAAAGYTLQVAGAGLAPAESRSFAVAPGLAARLAFVASPQSATSGKALLPAVQVEVRDEAGNLVPDATPFITLSLAENPAGEVLHGSARQQAQAGRASFAGVFVEKAGSGYTLVAEADGLAPASSAPFSVHAGMAHHLAFLQQPQGAVAGASLPDFRVQVQDAAGNRVGGSNASITLQIPGGIPFNGPRQVVAVNGVATFTGLRLDRAGTHRFEASAPSLIAATSDPFEIRPAAPARLVFQVPPTDVVSLAPMIPVPEVAVLDQAGNLIPTLNGAVSLEWAAPTEAVLGGGQAQLRDGVAAFPDLRIDRAGTYRLIAKMGALSSEASVDFSVTHGGLAALRVAAEPGDERVGERLAPLEVELLDAAGNLLTDAPTLVTLALVGGSPAATLQGTLAATTSGGRARFDDLRVDQVGEDYRIEVRAGALDPVRTSPFHISGGSPALLAWVQGPSPAVSGEALAPAIRVEVLDRFGVRVEDFDGPVRLAVASGPAGATLRGTLTQNADQGLATFADLSLDLAGAYTLAANVDGVASAQSAPFEVRAGLPSGLRWIAQPADRQAVELLPAVTVHVVDAAGNRSDSDETVAIELVGGPGGVPLRGESSREATAGAVSFGDLQVPAVGTYALRARVAGLPPADSQAFEISPGPAAALHFLVQPVDGKRGAPLAEVQVELRDAEGNRSSESTEVTLTLLGGNPAALGGNTARGAAAGFVAFDDLTISEEGEGYRLNAEAPALGLPAVPSEAFRIAGGSPARLAWRQVPTDTTSNQAPSPAVVVEILDALGERVEDFADPVTLHVVAGPPGATLVGDEALPALGLATFAGLQLDRAGSYVIEARAPGLPALPSPTFSVSPGIPAHLVFRQGPFNLTAGDPMDPPVIVEVLDAAGNLVDTDRSVSLALVGQEAFPIAAVDAVGGVATFDDLRIDEAGRYALVATMWPLTSDPSREFTVHAGSPHELVFVVSPLGAVAGQSFSVELHLRDEAGNLVPEPHEITLTLQGGEPGATLEGPRTRSTAGGVVTFDGLRIEAASESDYTLIATGAGFTEPSAPFSVLPGPAVALAWLSAPQDVGAGQNVGPLVVEVRDAHGNAVFTYDGDVELELVPAAPLTGATVVGATKGKATFDPLSITKAGTDYVFVVQGDGWGPFSSTWFDVHAGAPEILLILSQPTGGEPGKTLPDLRVALEDEHGNRLSNRLLTIELQGGDPDAKLGGVLSALTIDGVATFTGLVVDRPGADYELLIRVSGEPMQAPTLPFPVESSACGLPLVDCGGVCVDTRTDWENCGGCGNLCDGEAACREGVCVDFCPAGESRCGGTCVDFLEDEENCGGCGAEFACDTGEVCNYGTCVPEPDRRMAQWPLPPEKPVRYTATAGTVTDEVTGLVWQRQLFSTTLGWDHAFTYCDQLVLEGKSDWRVPTMIELRSLVDTSVNNPAINRVYFEGDLQGSYWSSEERAGSTSNAWYLSFSNGAVDYGGKTGARWVRCVRGGFASASPIRFEVQGDTVYDHHTKLTWQKAALVGDFTHAAAREACASSSVGGYDDWRLPEKKELESLIDHSVGYGNSTPLIDRSVFDGTVNASDVYHWTASTYLRGSPSNAWRVSFYNGRSETAGTGNRYKVRCVRDDFAAPTCDEGEALCEGGCTLVVADAANCGACNHACEAGEYCVDGACADSPDYDWARWPVPKEGQADYDTSHPEIVIDNVTGLQWQKGVSSPTTMNWANAKAYCAGLNLGGHDDWRLPSAIELLTLVDYGKTSLKIDDSAFPGANAGNHWTASRSRGTSNPWFVSFGAGTASNVGTAGAGNAYRVRCVRGDAMPWQPRYEADAETVRDLFTGLVWQRHFTAGNMRFDEAEDFCERFHMGGHRDWRRPSLLELHTLVYRRNAVPGSGIVTPVFPSGGTRTWSSSVEGNPASPSGRWNLNFADGTNNAVTNFTSTSSSHWRRLRCVREEGLPAPSCAAPLTACDSSCVDTDTDAWHCGGCNQRCGEGEVCDGGSCAPALDRGMALWSPPPLSPPDANYLDHGDVVEDLTTELIWQKRAMQYVDAFSNASAARYCATLHLAGHNDWRLPTNIELLSLTDHSRSAPALNPSAFPGAHSGTYLTTTGSVSPDGNHGGTGSGFVRCVRGGPKTPRQAFRILDDAGNEDPDGDVALDPNTGLMWARAHLSTTLTVAQVRSGPPNLCAPYNDQALGGYSDWRMANKRELETLVEPGRSNPAYDPAVFLGSRPSYFSAVTLTPGNAVWRFDPNAGTFVTHTGTNASHQHPVRCVRSHF